MKSRSLSVLFFLAALVAINWAASRLYFRWDFTADKRYTLSPATKKLLQQLDSYIFIDVYLHGEFPPAFERLENATRETLEAFKAVSNGRISFRFTDPTVAATEEKRQENYSKLIAQGIPPTNLFASEGGKRTEKLIFPAAMVRGSGMHIPVQLLKSNRSKSDEEQLNQSYEGVEFQLVSAIREIVQPERKKVGMLVSHSKLPPGRMSDLIATVQLQYDVFLDLNQPGSYEGLDALIVMKPDSAFSEEEKYKLDQYIVKGGKALFFVDGADVDSVALEGSFANALQLNLSDLFFKWGIRINHDLVKDLNCAHIPMNVGNMGERPQIQPVPWRYYPLLNNFSDHPVTRNLEALYTRYLSSIDTVGASTDLQRKILVSTSPYTRMINTPVLVSYNEARQQPAPDSYRGGEKIAAILLEGNFSSLYQHRILPSDPRHDSFVPQGTGGKVVVCSDGDLIINDIDQQRQAPLPLGYDRITRLIFGNKDFVLHALDYLTDAEGIITSRNRQVSIRLLDKIRIGEERLFWQSLNLLLPILLICLPGGLISVWRDRKFRSRIP